MSAETFTLPQARHACGTVYLPGSKSISNRALLAAALATGETRLSGLLHADDTTVMLNALRTLGVRWSAETRGRQADVAAGNGTYTVHGAPDWPVKQADLFLGNAGTAFRPLTAVLALMGGAYHLDGVARMRERPIGDLVDALRQLGAIIHYVGQPGYPPLRLDSDLLHIAAPLRVRGTVSSQFLTALLMAAPIAARRLKQDVVIDVEGTLISRPYIEITLAVMRQFGVHVKEQDWARFIVPADAGYKAVTRYAIEGDASSASYFLGLGLLGSGPLTIQGVGRASIQGDAAFVDVIRAMGGQVQVETDALQVTGVDVRAGGRLKAFDLDFNAIPDAAMTAAVLALYADGPCHLRNIASWRVKETDRIAAMHAELGRLGARVEASDDRLTVHPIAPGQWRDADIRTYDDHRMAMSFSLAAFGDARVRILDPKCVSKTYPQYFTDFQKVLVASSAP